MTTPPIDHYVSDSPAIADLTAQYGDRLQRMTFYESLLAIMLLSSALSDGFLYPDGDPSIEQQISRYLNTGYPIDHELQAALAALDDCDERQVTAVLVALVGYTSAQLSRIAMAGGLN